jgi:2-polyprenyl-6-methoxyphenol hydroxylase-like FAD-dependent oxidoreductase
MEPPWDAVIVGAGPAGAATAWSMAGRDGGRRILLLDADDRPRHRPCGEYLAPAGVGALERMGLASALPACGAHPLAEVAMRAPGGGWSVPHAPVLGLRPPAVGGLGVRRERFDLALQEAAGARCELRRGRRVVAGEAVAGGWRLRLSDGSTLSTRLLVGADGRGSLVRRIAGLDRPPQRRRFALVARAHGVAHGDAVEMHLGPLGQIGVCPLGDGEVNLNLLIAPSSAVLLRRMPRERLLRAALAATPTLAGRLGGLRLGPVLATGSLPQGCRAVAAPGVALVGDAAGFCDPFTGEGMSLALCEAEALGAAIADEDLAAYATFFARSIGRRRRVGEALQGLLTRRRIGESAVALLARLPLVHRLLVADAAGYRRSA